MRSRFIISVCIVLAACSTVTPSASVPESTATQPIVATAAEAISTETPALPSTPQPFQIIQDLGPELENFPAGVNLLTGRAVSDPSLLGLPAVLVSISNMPVTTRPQAGPGFAAWVFELYIGEGATRFMNVFYGEYPRFVPNLTGGCEVRAQVFHPQGAWVGNRVWLDENENGIHDAWEFGVGGVCVRLLSESGEVIAETSTDSNGYYAFDIVPARHQLEFVLPERYRFTTPNLGDEDNDSDADVQTGRTALFTPDATVSFLDAGLILASDAPIATPSIAPPTWFIPKEVYVGPIRSGRLTYNQIGRLFPNSCLVYASAAWDIGERLDACEIVLGVDKTTPNSALLTIRRMRELAQASLNPRQPVNYSGNVFSATTLPPNGQPAESIHIFYHAYTQSGWEYDPVSQSYLRSTDYADGKGNLRPATDRLTGRQTAFENVIVLFAEHERFRHNQFEIDLSLGQKGWAWLFRDGQAFKVQWSTLGRTWEKSTGLMRPLYFVDPQNNPIPLRPGRTWIHLVTPFSVVSEQGEGRWLMQFVQPYDPLDTPVP